MKKFCDLLWTVRTIEEYESKYQCKITKSHLLRILNDSFLGGRRTKQPASILNLLIEMELLGIDSENLIFLTSRGKRFSNLENNYGYELSSTHKKFLASWYIPFYSEHSKAWIKYFVLDSNGQYQAFRSEIKNSLQQWTEEMLYLGVAMKNEKQLMLQNEYFWIYSEAISYPPMTLEELQHKLKMQAEAGRAAELYALEFERQRLEECGYVEEAKRVECISESLVNAGYDILSFSSPSPYPNRFIEVKSFNTGQSFYWSHHEIEVAKVLGDSYYLYLVNHTNPVNPEIRIIQNPNIYIPLNAVLEPTQYRVIL